MSSKRAFLLGLVIAIAGATAAAQMGGWPSRPFLQYLGVGIAASSGVTRIRADNAGSGDSEILAQTTNSGNAQFRATNLGASNWSFGNLRSDNSFDICFAASLTTGCALALSSTVMTSPTVNGSTDVKAGGVSVCRSDSSKQCAMGSITFFLSTTGGSATPTITTCTRCSSPSISRLGTGNWQLTLGVNQNVNSALICNWQSPPSNSASLQFGGDATNGTGTILVRLKDASTGALTDPASSATLQCAAGS